jgi:hypothetical protein
VAAGPAVEVGRSHDGGGAGISRAGDIGAHYLVSGYGMVRPTSEPHMYILDDL